MTTLQKILEPEVLLGIVTTFLYITGRISKKQFVVEQKKAKGMIPKTSARQEMEKEVVGVVGKVLDVADMVPGINARLPIINKSVPKLAKGLLSGCVGLIGDVMYHAPLIGSKVKTPGGKN